MATTEMNCLASGGGGVYKADHYASGVPQKITLGFKPKYIAFFGVYAGSATMACYYNEDDSPTSMQRVYGAGETTFNFPNTTDAGIQQVDVDGFEIYSNADFTYAYYVAVG